MARRTRATGSAGFNTVISQLPVSFSPFAQRGGDIRVIGQFAEGFSSIATCC
ncbi:MAG: hypothetical protein ABR538_08465 [Candidatus Binatia bacterium]